MKKGEFGHRPECRKKAVKTQGGTGLPAGQGETHGMDSSGRKEPALRHLPCETIHSCWSKPPERPATPPASLHVLPRTLRSCAAPSELARHPSDSCHILFSWNLLPSRSGSHIPRMFKSPDQAM